MLTTESPIAELCDLLDRRFGVDALWIFGSEAAGSARPDSDLDVGALFRDAPSPVAIAELAGDAEALVGRPVDLVDLDEASPLLAYQVLKHGRLVIDRSPSRRHAFTAALPARREDLLVVRRPIEKRLVPRTRPGPPMVERDVALAKVATIDRCLRRIHEARDPARRLSAQDAQDVVELNLMRAVQAGIDLAAHVVATEGLGMPAKLAETFTLLERDGLLHAELAARLRAMTGFRNIVIHEYEAADPAIVQSIVENHLDDLRELCRLILERFDVR